MESTPEPQQATIEELLRDVYSFVWPVQSVSAEHLGQIHRVWLQQQFTPPIANEKHWRDGMVQLENVSQRTNVKCLVSP